MDWNRTKSIFIFVFLILNIFLYWLYLNRYNEAQSVEILGEKTIEARLKDDNITYGPLPNSNESASYITGKVHNFKNIVNDDNQRVSFTDEKHAHIRVNFINPVKLRNISDDASFTDFVHTNVKDGDSYALWKVDREERVAIFFQKKNNRMFYYNDSALLKVQWNLENEVTMYEQTMIDNIEEMEQQETVIPPLQIFQTLYNKGLLKSESRIKHVKLGYSTFSNLTQTQVLIPTWEVQVELPDGEIEEYFVDAIDGKIIEIQGDKQKAEEEDWGVE
ncbi:MULTISPECIES: two-component system regulatory protein YycI [unclassified Lysinibacillus]|uniref:two-component system regulatory protein YycI n=1 Tax=unclassified Lysinibacillus TaxID=2636778 RepID=UPI001047DDD4|nr:MULTISPECIES: two-component system regulatory protein YycI [unclassified Lysinibacillus]MDD1501328.1 two-component system regulatory protein YycI [Lysinibacillus sp. CNPSo 3705]UPW83297.1 two-component system regulatory protein YycI [Lysinibacillus sp. Ag94]